MKCTYCGKNFNSIIGLNDHIKKNQKCINIRKEKNIHNNNRPLNEIELANKLFQNVNDYQIYTHNRLDADALFSVALIRSIQSKPEKIAQIEPSVPVEGEDVVGLDLEEGSLTIKGKGFGSCFGLLVKAFELNYSEYKFLYNELAKHINASDSGKYEHLGPFDPAFLIRYWRAAGVDENKMIEEATILLKGMQIYHENEMKVKKYYEENVKYNGYCALIIDPPSGAKVQKWAFIDGCAVYVFFNTVKEHSGMGAILNRELENTRYSLMLIEAKLPKGWLVMDHIAFWGSKKAPKDPNVSGISLEKFIDLINDSLEEFQENNNIPKKIKKRNKTQ